jgi:hypothetical protein
MTRLFRTLTVCCSAWLGVRVPSSLRLEQPINSTAARNVDALEFYPSGVRLQLRILRNKLLIRRNQLLILRNQFRMRVFEFRMCVFKVRMIRLKRRYFSVDEPDLRANSIFRRFGINHPVEVVNVYSEAWHLFCCGEWRLSSPNEVSAPKIRN